MNLWLRSTDQRFIFTEVTFYKIHILAVAGPVIQANGRLEFEDGSPAALCVTLNLSSASTWTLWGEPHSTYKWLLSCSHYWNRQFQTSEDFDILIVVSKAKFEKTINGQTRFCQDRPNFV